MKHYLPNSLRALFLSLAVLMFLPMLPQKPEFVARDYKLHELVVDKNNDIFAGELVAPNSMMCNITNSSVKASTATTTEDARAYEAMAGEWIMTTASGNKWTVIVHAASEGEPDYNRVLNITGMMGYPWTNLKMYYSYNYELGKPEIYVKAGTLFAGGVNFSGIGPCNVYLYNLVDGYLTTTDFAANISADRKIIDFGEATFTGALFQIPSGAYSGYVWFRETGVKMTQMYKIKQDGLYYNLDAGNNQATVVQNSEGKYSGDIIIPESVERDGITYSVTSIGDYAFYGCSGLTSVTIGNSVERIGSSAFYECSGLTSVTIGNSVTSIGDYAFYGCSGLTSVTIPNSVKSIGYEAFSYCSGLTSVTLGNSVTSIGYEAFSYCSGLTSVTIPNSVTSIGKYAFYECSGLTSVFIPNSVKSIGEDAFAYCFGLTSVHISDIAAWCNIDFADYDSNPLYYANHLYLNGEEVKDLVIPNSVTSIGKRAFAGCSDLTSVTIPNSVTSIGYEAFSSCFGLTSVVVEVGNPVYDSRNNCNAIIETATNTLHLGCKTTVIPNSVTSIGKSAFRGCHDLTSVTIPNSVTSIGDYAFYNCSGLTSVTIPNSVTSIGDYAFPYCRGLTSVTIPNSVTSIGDYAFYNCFGLTSVTIPNSVTSIGYEAFSSCFGLTSVVVEDGNPVYDSRNNCNAIIETATNTLHLGCKTTVIPNSVTWIGDHAFQGCHDLTSVTIPNSVTSIGSSAFECCFGLTSVTIGNSVTSIGKYAFYECSELLDVYCYAEKVPSTESDAFVYSPIADATLHVPNASVDSYKATAPWSSFGKIVALTEDETGIDELKGENGKVNQRSTPEGAEVKTALYDLSGRRVQKAQKGIFIQNGRVVVK